MKKYQELNIEGAILDEEQLKRHLEKMAMQYILKNKSNKNTYPIPELLEKYITIKMVYNLLNEHIKLGISIHPAGEWILDNFYIIEESVRQIEKEISINKYTNFPGIQNGKYAGFARIYVLATEIIAYTDNKINGENLEKYLQAYQTQKTLHMEEIWNIGVFLQIAIIKNIAEICEKIYISQVQKYKVRNIIERLVEKKSSNELKFNQISGIKLKNNEFKSMKYPFIEYMSYSLKKYGKKAYGYLNILEDEVEKLGITVPEAIQKEHFDTAIRKISMANCITSIKIIQRINFLEIFEKINGVEEILNQDPAGIYENMEYKTKEYYRNAIKEIAKKTQMSEIYISKKAIDLCRNHRKELTIVVEEPTPMEHIGYYLIGDGKEELYEKLEYKEKILKNQTKVKIYIWSIIILTISLSLIISKTFTKNLIQNIITTIILIIPISEFVIQTIQYIVGKIVKPKLIPKMDFSKGINKENATFVVIPTIIKTKEKVEELFRKLEVFYLANQSENLYFALLGDCSESEDKQEQFDEEVEEEGLKQVEKLNQKYSNNQFPKFHFIYRERKYNESEEKFLGWERKRGLLTQFNEYILKHERNKFRINTINQEELPQIKYVITLDSDTDLVLNTAFELVGAMAHILNKPEIDPNKNIVIKGHAIIQPRVGINLNVTNKNMFTKIFAGSGGIDSYTNAISDTYQDNFGEGIFTGKGIYDVEVFSKVLKHEIPENTVLSHDLLEGNYLRCGLVSDIMLMDGYPLKYASFMNRLSRWIRGDWQIAKWLSSKLNLLSKYKIFDNLRRSLFEISIIILLAWLVFTQNKPIYTILLTIGIVIYPFLLEIINLAFSRKEGEKKQKKFIPDIAGFKGAIYRAILTLGCLPYKAYVELISIVKTIYRVIITQKHLLEWMTSEEAEKQSQTNLMTYYKMMLSNVILGVLAIAVGMIKYNYLLTIIGVLWIIIPLIMCEISKTSIQNTKKEELNKEEEKKVYEIAERTWKFFKDYLTAENNYLIPDNYQEGRKPEVVARTSSTNIGLAMLAVISSYDLGFENLVETINLLNNIINSVEELPKWNGHLYNWYNIKTKQPLIPRYVSTVDSGNLVGYMYTTKAFLENIKDSELQEKIQSISFKLTEMIDQTNFRVLYSEEQRVFSIGYNIEDNKLTDSYYDLLASEARQASLVAIAKKDVPAKHWNNLSRTLTVLKKYKGLISWSGTAFEYLMPNINIPRYEGSLLDESCKFAIMNQLEYSKKLGIPWGISESAFNLKDLHSNYQYKAFGIPWLGLKRGLADEMVVSSYGSILAITDMPKEVVENLKIFESQEMYNKYGFYEAIDYTAERLSKGKKYETVKTYMAHHQALILLSINNLFNDNIFQKRFMQNPEIEAVSILLQERMPETFITTKENKEKPEKIKYEDYENYSVREYNKIDERISRGNVIGNEKYVVAINQQGVGVSKFEENYINRFKKTDDYNQGIFFYIKDIETNEIWSATGEDDCEKCSIQFMPDRNQFEKTKGLIKTTLSTTVDANEPVEIRRLEIQNNSQEEKIFEVTSFFEPVLSKKEQDYAHQAFNNLFLVYKYDEELDAIVVKRRARDIHRDKKVFLIAKMQTNCERIGETEFEISKEKFMGRNNLGLPIMIKNSNPLSKKDGLTTEGIIALKNTIKVQPGEEVFVDLILSVEYDKETAIDNIQKYNITENITREFEIVKAKTEAEARYLEIKGRDIDVYQTIISYILFDNPLKQNQNLGYKGYEQKDLWKYGISGDLPIITVTIKFINDLYVIKQIIKAYEYLKIRNIKVELVIIDEEDYSYENYIRDEIEGVILNSHLAFMKNIYGGIFILSKSEMDIQDVNLIKFVSTLVIDSHLGNLENIIKDMEEEVLDNYRIVEKSEIKTTEEDTTKDVDILNNSQNPKYYNEYGAFSEDGKEYIIRVNKENKVPTTWSHIMANENFGTVVTECNGGYTWYKNSRLNRVTSWHNSSSVNIPSEAIYLKDLDNGRIWSPTAMPMPDDKNYNAIFGFGYAKYIHSSDDILQELEVFVPQDEAVKINILTLKNNAPKKKKIKVVYYLKPVLGEDEIKSDGYIKLQYEENANVLVAKNLYKTEEFENIVYISSSEKIKSFTGNKKSFFGNGGITNSSGLHRMALDNDNGLGKKSCIAIEIEVEIDSFSDKKISIVMGADDNIVNAKDIAYKYSKVQNCNMELSKTKYKWNELLGRVQVYTPYESLNIMLNGWTMYQTIVSRLLGRSGFYQSGGAFGFRDQLQDAFATKYIDTQILYNQIIKHSKHQFIEGDVEHWWHEENNRGIRTKFSDDLLWLPFAVIQYISYTGDYNILKVKTPYLQGAELQEHEKERYDKYLPGDVEETIYQHCKKAIDRACNFGENGLPKIGIGDWNDGFSNIGPEGKGESVWLGFFLYMILEGFVSIAENKHDNKTADKYRKIMDSLRFSLNNNGWDGRWYKRAFADNGDVYGSMENEECKIDSIAQSWSVISGVGEENKKISAMESFEKHLVDTENGIIKLLDPPFYKGKLEPGYIKAYLPGVRENGGQYTHAAIWAIIAEAILGKGDKAVELYRMITPIEHSRTKEAANKYKVEPYVIAADVYSYQNLAGCGGWTWYTGSSSWYYIAGIQYLLGLNINHNTLSINPCIPKDWEEYSIRFKFGESIYNIKVKNPNRKNTGVEKVILDGTEIENEIKLDGSGKIFNVEVIM